MTDTAPAARFCANCGAELPDEARFCPACGTPRSGGTAAPPKASATEARRPTEPGARNAEEELFEFRPLAVQSFWHLLLALLTLGIAWLVLWISRLTTTYRITTERIEIRTGLFNVTRRTIELFRVEDVEIQEPLFLRLRDAGTLVVRSQDAGEPEVVMAGVPSVRVLHERLREEVRREREEQRVRLMEGF